MASSSSTIKPVKFDDPKKVAEECGVIQSQFGDCQIIDKLPKMKSLQLVQNDLEVLSKIWNDWNSEKKERFNGDYGHIGYLLNVKPDDKMIRASIQFWEPSYRCFTFNEVDLTPTIEEYTALLNLKLKNPDKVYRPWAGVKNKLSEIMGMHDKKISHFIKKKGENECVRGDFLVDFIYQHREDEKSLQPMALAIYGLVIFPHALGHISGEVVNLVKQIEQGVNPVPVILAETILSLNFCRRKGDGQFKGCIQLFYVWMRSHFQSRQAFFTPTYRKDRYPLKEFCHGVWPSKESKEEWIITFQHLRNDEVVWKTDWMPHDSALYRCGKYLWVPLLGLWGAVSYAPMMVRRQFGSEQFVPVTHDLNQLEFTYRDKDTTKSIKAIILAWEHTRRLRQSKYVDKATQDYLEWHSCRGKSVCGLKVYGPSLPIANDPRHFQFEIEARREIAYKKLQAENEALIKENKRMKGEISSWRDEIEQSNKKVRNLKRYIRGINQKKQKRKISKLRRTVVQLKLEAQEMIEDLEEDLNIQIREYDQAREGELHLQAMVQNLNGEIQRKQDVIQTLSAECDRLLMKCESLRSTRDSYETVKAQAQHLLVEVRSVTKKAREMASAVNDLRGVIVPGNAERGQLLNLLDCLYKQLDHVGKFY